MMPGTAERRSLFTMPGTADEAVSFYDAGNRPLCLATDLWLNLRVSGAERMYFFVFLKIIFLS